MSQESWKIDRSGIWQDYHDNHSSRRNPSIAPNWFKLKQTNAARGPNNFYFCRTNSWNLFQSWASLIFKSCCIYETFWYFTETLRTSHHIRFISYCWWLLSFFLTRKSYNVLCVGPHFCSIFFKFCLFKSGFSMDILGGI